MLIISLRMTIGWIEEFVRDGEAVDGFKAQDGTLACLSQAKVLWVIVGAAASVILRSALRRLR